MCGGGHALESAQHTQGLVAFKDKDPQGMSSWVVSILFTDMLLLAAY